MTHRMRGIAEEIVRLQSELDREIESRRAQLGWSLKENMVRFERGIAIEHRRLRKSALNFIAGSNLLMIVSAPLIYSLIVPLLLFDAWLVLYQGIYFRICRVPAVKRADYFKFDRKNLAYLNWIEALNCAYCSYANGLIAFAREIGARTEQYWCPIKHALRISDPHQRYRDFLEYGDAEGYRERLDALREALRAN